MTSITVPPVPSDGRSIDIFQAALDSFADPVFVKDTQHRWCGVGLRARKEFLEGG